MTTTAAIFHGVGTALELRELPVPPLRDREILVEVTACTLCGSDLHTVSGRRAVAVPTILGHETLGRIAEFGPGAPAYDAAGQPLAVGDRVTWAIVANCGHCFYCLRDLPQKCSFQTKYGHEPLARGLTGGLAGHCVLSAGTAVFLIPETLTDAAACPANCAGATVAAAIEAAGTLAGARVLVMGSGMLGVTAAAWARARGARVVIVCDVDPTRLRIASEYGATHETSPCELADLADATTGGHGVDVAFELTGAPDAFEAMLPRVRMGGKLVLVGAVYPARPVPVAIDQVVRRCLTIHGIHNYAPRHLQAAIQFLASNPSLPFAELVSAWQPLAAVERALHDPLAPGTLRLGIRPRA